CSGHGTSLVLAVDGAVVRAASLERLCRVKRAVGVRMAAPDAAQVVAALQLPRERVVPLEEWLPRMAAEVLAAEGLGPGDVAMVARPARDLLDMGEGGRSAAAFVARLFPGAALWGAEHHHAHALQAFLPSGFERAAVLT